MYQEINKSHQVFYTKIRHLIDLVGYADAVKDQVAETAFINGLAKELAIAVRSSPVALNLAQKVDYAHRYWTTRNPTTTTFQQVLAPHLRSSIARPSVIPPIAPSVNDPTTWRSAQFQSPMDKKLEELTDAVSKMTAHIANLDRRNERRPPIQRFSVQNPATGSNTQAASCRRCGQTGHWINQCPQPDPRTCFKCGKQGHIMTYCRSETNRQA